MMVHMRNYRDGETFAAATHPETPVGGVLRITLPEPPSVNAMLSTAGASMFGYHYVRETKAYKRTASTMLDVAGLRPPAAAWARWSIIRVDFRLHNLRDPLELMASLKWAVDLLVELRWVEDDSPRHLIELCIPTQSIDREHRGVDLYLRRDG